METQEDPPPGVPEWVVTYGDMMSLLLTFFIMLVSLSEMKEDGELRAMLDHYRETFGNSPLMVAGVPGKSLQSNSAYNKMYSSGRRGENGTKKGALEGEGPGGEFKPVDRINHGEEITIGGPAQFDQFQSVLNDKIKADLDILITELMGRSNRIIIRGHASPEPLPAESAYRDQFDLSYARAVNVADYLVEHGILKERLVISAAGDTEPRLMTRDPELQSLNRRVDIFLIDSYVSTNDFK